MLSDVSQSGGDQATERTMTHDAQGRAVPPWLVGTDPQVSFQDTSCPERRPFPTGAPPSLQNRMHFAPSGWWEQQGRPTAICPGRPSELKHRDAWLWGNVNNQLWGVEWWPHQRGLTQEHSGGEQVRMHVPRRRGDNRETSLPCGPADASLEMASVKRSASSDQSSVESAVRVPATWPVSIPLVLGENPASQQGMRWQGGVPSPRWCWGHRGHLGSALS